MKKHSVIITFAVIFILTLACGFLDNITGADDDDDWNDYSVPNYDEVKGPEDDDGPTNNDADVFEEAPGPPVPFAELYDNPKLGSLDNAFNMLFWPFLVSEIPAWTSAGA